MTCGPLAHADRHDAPGLIRQSVPGVAAVIDDGVVRGGNAVRQLVVAHELPNVLDRVQLGALGRQWHDGDVRRHDEALGDVPAGLIDQQRTMFAGRHPGRDLGQVQAHCLGVAPGQDQAGHSPGLGADGAEDVGGRRALVLRGRGPGAAPGPPPGDLVLLSDPGLVAEPNLYVVAPDLRRARDRIQARGETVLKSSMAPATCA